MPADTIGSIEALLTRAKEAHGIFEATELGGVYDEDWPTWYARYAVEHGIGDLVERPVGVDELTDVLSRRWEGEAETESGEAGDWYAATARRIATEFGG
jgi:hypothetical protein